jgi:hypothetical protein
MIQTLQKEVTFDDFIAWYPEIAMNYMMESLRKCQNPKVNIQN